MTNTLNNEKQDFKILLIHFRYRADDVTGYVADVRYEGEVKPFVPPPPVAAKLQVAKSLAPRPIAKRNENTSEDDFEASPELKQQVSNKRHKKQQKVAQQQQHLQQQPQYYKPQPYRPF